MKNLLNRKIIISIIIGIFILGGIKILFFGGYPFLIGYDLSSSHEETKNIVDLLGHFHISNEYVLQFISKGMEGENIFLIYSNKKTSQKIIVVRIREHQWDNLDRIELINKSYVPRTFEMISLVSPKVSSFKFTYLLPFFFRKDDLSGMGNEAIVRGMNVKTQERYQTSSADIDYIRGEFSKIGLYKEKKGIWNYPIPVLDFETLHEGALAFVQSKKSRRVTVCVSVNHYGAFQESDFKEFLQSFDPA